MALYSLFKITVLCVLFHEVAAIVRRQPLPPALARAPPSSLLWPSITASDAAVTIDAEAPLTERTRTLLAQPQSCTPKPPSCTGNLADRSPFGVYTANNVPTPFDSHFVTHVELNFTTSVTPNFHDVTYELDVTGCVFDPTPPYNCRTHPAKFHAPMPFTGYFIGENVPVLIPVANQDHGGHKLNLMEQITNTIFGHGIQWCPKENHFVLHLPKVLGVRPIGTKDASYCTLFGPPMMHAAVPAYAGASE